MQQMEKLKTKIREIREDEQYVNESKSKVTLTKDGNTALLVRRKLVLDIWTMAFKILKANEKASLNFRTEAKNDVLSGQGSGNSSKIRNPFVQIESLQTELEQQLAVQKSMRKARETVEEENAVVAKLERRMQSVYSSLELQTMSVDRLQKTVDGQQ